VTDASTISGHRPAAIGPGRLVLVVGPSGAGKDTLIGMARAACSDARSIVFPRRVVTREASSAEDNVQTSPEGFRQALAHGDFAVHWEAHGHCYALPRAIDDDVRAGRTVVANVSRTVVEAMRRAYADVAVVEVTAPSDILAERLAARARSSDGQLTERLRRALDGVAAAPDVTINNVGSAEHHAAELVRIIKGN
jgi:ribose 1,5-bisphosphokinase